jgi:hypothetical protein
MFAHIDGVMPALDMKITQWNDDVFFTVKFVRQKWSKYYPDLTPMTGMLLMSAHIHDPVQQMRWFKH